MRPSYNVIEPKNINEKLAPIILLHGRMDSKKTWKHLAQKIADNTGRKVYCTDARNHGSTPWNDDMSFEVLTRDLEDFVVEQGMKKAVLVGHSMGGRTAITLALQRPELVEKLFVEDMVTTNYTSVAKMSVLQIMNLLRQSLSAIPAGADEKTAKTAIVEFIKSQLPPSFTEGKSSTIFDLDTMPIRKEGSTYSWEANLDVLEKMLTSDENEQQLTGVYDGPTFFLYGTESFFDVPSDENINKFFPKAVKVPVKGCGHLIHQDFPEEFLRHVTEFINAS